MIGQLRGTIVSKRAPELLLDVNGVGYEMEVPMTSFYELPGAGNEVTLFTHLAVREDAHTLYGFANRSDRDLFRNLIKVSGVGGKLALALLSGMSSREFVMTVQANDISSLTRIPGVGKKTAERLVIDMRDRLKDWQSSDNLDVADKVARDNAPPDGIRDAISALVALGFKPPEASRMVSAINTDGLASEEIIRQALQAISN